MKTIIAQLAADLLDLQVSSQMHAQRSLDRANIYKRFVGLKEHFASATDRDGKYTFHFLCSIEALPQEERDTMIKRITMYLDANPESATKQIGELMHKMCLATPLKFS